MTRKVLPEATAYLQKQKWPLSGAVEANGLLWLSGQTPLDNLTGERELGSAKDQTRVVMENIARTLQANGGSLQDVIRATIYLTAASDLPQVNEVYQSYFNHPYPARSAVVVAALVNPMYRIEIDIIASVPAPKN